MLSREAVSEARRVENKSRRAYGQERKRQEQYSPFALRQLPIAAA